MVILWGWGFLMSEVPLYIRLWKGASQRRTASPSSSARSLSLSLSRSLSLSLALSLSRSLSLARSLARSSSARSRPRFFFSFFFFTLVAGPRRSLNLKLSDTRVYEPEIRARLGTASPSSSARSRPRFLSGDAHPHHVAHANSRSSIQGVSRSTRHLDHG